MGLTYGVQAYPPRRLTTTVLGTRLLIVKLEEVATKTGYSLDQARRRVNELARLKLIERMKLLTEQNRWDYSETAVEMLLALAHFERDLSMTATDGLRRLLEDKLGRHDPRKTVAELEAELAEKVRLLQQRDQEIHTLHERIKDMRARLLPVEREVWHKRLVRWATSIFRRRE